MDSIAHERSFNSEAWADWSRVTKYFAPRVRKIPSALDPVSLFSSAEENMLRLSIPDESCEGRILPDPSLCSEAWAGIEPARGSFADSCVTTSPPGRCVSILARVER